MPFDECNQEGGGGGGHNPHDPELLQEMAVTALATLSLDCELNDACEFHAGIIMQAMMFEALTKSALKYKDGGAMLQTQIDLLRRAITKMEEEKRRGTQH